MRNLKKSISLLLVCTMLLTALPPGAPAHELDNQNANGPAIAADALAPGLNNPIAGEQSNIPGKRDEPETVANSLAQAVKDPQAREQLIAALAEQYGAETAAAMVESMIAAGIIDENGARLTYKIEMDGQLYTLEQMRDIVHAAGVDLSREVKVDDQPVTLGFIAQLIDFETYLTFVEENFLKNNVQVTDEHWNSLEGLADQLTTKGISLVTGTPEPAAVANTVYSMAAEPAAVPVVEYRVGAGAGNTIDITYTMSGGEADSSVSFSQEYLPGVLGDSSDSLTPVTLGGSNPTCPVTIQLPDTDNVCWNGDAPVGYVRLTDLKGGQFPNGKSSQLIPLTLNSEYAFTAFKGANFLKNPAPNSNLDGWQVTNGHWHDGSYGGEIKGNASSTVTAWQDVQLNAGGRRLAANGELIVGASGYFWGQASSTMTASLTVTFYDQNDSVLDSKKVSYKKYKVAHHNENLSFSDYTVPAGAAYMRLTAVNDNSLTLGPSMRNFSLTLTDIKAPAVTGISSPAKTFKAGEQVPIVVTFSEPVVQNQEFTLTMKDSTGAQYAVKSKNTGLVHEKVTFMFDIPPQTPITLWPVSISAGAVDTSGLTGAAYAFPDDVAPLATVFVYNELDSILGLALKHADGSAAAGTYLPEESMGVLEINLFQSNAPAIDSSTVGQKQNEWLVSHTTPDTEGKFIVDRLYASYDNGVSRIPLYITDAMDKLTAGFNLPAGGGAYKMRLYIDPGGTNEFRTIFDEGYSAGFSKGDLVLVAEDDMTICYPASYPSGIDRVLYLGDDEAVKLTYSYSGNATFKSPADFKWVSSDENVAAISATGEITPVGVGRVTFNLVAMNGAGDGSRDVSKASEEFTVQASLSKPSLAVSKFITTRRGEPAQVMWSTNVIFLNQQAQPPKDTIFTVELYEGNYTGLEDLAGITPLYTESTEAGASSFTIPGDKLDRLSSGTEPAYTVKISTENPFDAGKKVEATGNIIVTSAPANVKITRPAGYYILDTADPLNVTWESTNVNDTPGGCDFEFAVSKNQDLLTTSQAASGSYTITFADVNGKLKDVYTVTARIKNTGDEAYSYDSFVLHVYDADAMKIWVDKQDVSTLVMDNEGRIKDMTSADIVALERNIFLTNNLSINYGDYPYGSVTDQIEWKSSRSDVAGINYSQGGVYKNIEDYNNPSFMPNTNFILAGLKDGATTIDATHKLSRMNDTLGVEVKTLKDKLYLFQTMPMAVTEFNYTNGAGKEVNVSSDTNGALAIYEPEGIKGDVKLKSIINDSTYLGTIYNANLLSGENDGAKGQLYPINNFVLRKAAQVDFNFKKPDGTPYNGPVTIRGGVYKNGNYCETAEVSDNAANTGTITPVDGFYRQVFDITRFWSAAAGETSACGVNATDKIDYIFEFHFGNDEYQPQIVRFSGNLSGADVLRFGESVVNLVPTVEKNKPFFSAQYLDRYKSSGRLDNIKNYTGNIGLNAQTPVIRIDTQALWWGRPVEETNAAISLLNEAGAVLAGQNYKTFRYPFATMLVTEGQLLIDEKNIWIDKKGRGKLTVKLLNEDGTLYNSTLAPYSVRNMLDVENVEASQDINTRFKAELQKNIKAGASFQATDKFAQGALNFISGIKFGNDNFSLMLAPTADPTVFKGILQLNAGDDVMDMGPDQDGFSLMLDDDEVDSIGAGKAGFARARELANGIKDDIESLLEDSDGSLKYQVGGYFSCKIYYNFNNERWEIQPVGGGIRAGIGYEYSKSGTEFISYVPVTYEIALGAAVRLEFDAHMLYEPVSVGGIDYYWQSDYESVTDYLTNLRIKAYIYAFGGLGIDYTIIALKIGVFGQLELENENKFLNRNYLDAALADQKALSGSKLDLQGQVGIKFVAKILFISYKKTLASAKFSKEWTYRNWDKINQYWRETTGDMLTMQNMSLATRMYAAATGQDMIVITAAPALESRDYLNDYARAWGTPGGRMRPLSLDINNLAPSTLQSNAYPYANPLIAGDGSLFVYLSDNNSPDVWDTTANYAVKEGGSYADKGVINAAAGNFGDSQLAFAGNNGLAISAWARLTDKIEKNAGDELSNAEIAMMMNNTEVYASIYRGGTWMTERLTNNSTPDMAPVVATNGSKAIVAWRSVYAGDEADPINFNGKDTIVYRIYDGSNWGEARTLYNGVSGRVTGLEAAMLSDGAAAISYVIDTSAARDTAGYELVYGVVASNGDIVNNVRLTNDNTPDENPQLAVVRINNEERFVLGWYKMEGEKTDVRLATFGNDGSPREDFVDSLCAVSNGGNISGNFKFANTNEADRDFKNLSILWVEPNTDDTGDSLKAIKFMQETVDDTQLIFTSAPVDIARMPDRTVIDSFDAYVSNAAADEVKVVILGTESKDEFDTITDGDGNTINVPRTESKMFTAGEAYQNKAAIKAADFDCTEIMSGFVMPIAFTVQNQGKNLITSVTLEYGTGEYGTAEYSGASKTFDNLKILPGASHTLVVYYAVPEEIADLTYRGAATFSGEQIDMTGGGTLPLAVADLGISSISTIKEMDGLREFAVTLYNSSDYKLSGSGKKVKLALYDNSAYTAGTEVVPVVTIVDPDELSLIDNGAFITNLSFDIKSYLLGKGKDEIPANGVTLYARAWVEDDSDKELAEFVGENNFSAVLCENLVKRNGGNAIKVDVQQSNSDTATTAVLTLQNLAMKGIAGGNVAVNLLDQGGNIIKTQYLSNTAEGLVNLGSEAVIQKTFVFDTAGSDVEAYYFTSTADAMNADLQVLAASGIGVSFDRDTATYGDLKANNLKSTNITAISTNPNARVLLKDAVDTVLAENPGGITYTLPLVTGSNSFKITVEPDGPGAQPKTYALTVANSAPAGGTVTLSTTATGTRGWWNSIPVPVILTATGLTNFTPSKMQYKINDGDWTNKNYSASPVDVTSITTGGTYVINARLQDNGGYNLTAGSLTVKVDGTAPTFAADKTSATLEENMLTVSTDVTDSLSGIYSVVMSRGGTDYAMQRQGDTATYTASVTADSVGLITIVATDMAGNTAQTYTGTDDTESIVVSVNPATVTVEKGKTQQFTATVTGNNNPDQTVTWRVSGGITGTSISEDGLLSITAAETANTLTVIATSTADNSKSGTATVTVTEPPAPPGGNTGGGGGDPNPAPVSSDTGSANVTPSSGGTVGLGNSATVTIPAGALSGNSAQEVTISKESSPPALPSGFSLLGNVYEFKVGNAAGYQFNKPVTLTFTFDPELVPPGSKPEVYYYDKAKSQWVNLGGEVSGQTIRVTVDHFTAFAVMARGMSEAQIPVENPEVQPEPVVLTDIAGHWAESSIIKLVGSGIIKGYPDGSFKPDAEISRAEFACILVKALELAPQKGKVFNDTADHWAGDYIATAGAYGIVTGFDSNTFGPDQSITREQMAVMLARAGNPAVVSGDTAFADNQDISPWAQDAVAALVEAGVMKGYPDNSFIPQGKATRAEAVIVILNSSKIA